jgi:hypothetical protein
MFYQFIVLQDIDISFFFTNACVTLFSYLFTSENLFLTYLFASHKNI